MKKVITWIALLVTLAPAVASAGRIIGLDDATPNIPQEMQDKLDDAILTYYQHPSKEKVETVLTIMNTSEILRKKGSWPTIIGFLAVVFQDNKKYLFDWMSLHDYNTYAEDVFVSALMHDNLRETASVFAQAHHWRKTELDRIRYGYDPVDLKHLTVAVPGHIDTLWGAFFGSGDPIYVNEIIGVLFRKDDPVPKSQTGNLFAKLPLENKQLAEKTLKQYAAQDKRVNSIVVARIASDKNPQIKSYLRRIILGEKE